MEQHLFEVEVVDPDPHRLWSAGSEFGREKGPTKLESNGRIFHGLKCWVFSFEGGRLLL
jgi:hypothetical protein